MMMNKSTGYFAQRCLGLLAFAAIASALAGCSDDAKPDLADAKKRMEKVQSFMDIYKSVNGDWSKLNDVQKAQVIKLNDNSEMKAHAGFIGAKEGPMAAQKFLAEARARGDK
jgi:hypothetical protein